MSSKLPSQKREKAARLVAEDHFSDAKIAEQCGITQRTLARWKNDETFAARVQDLVDAYAKRAMETGIARKTNRLAVLQDVHQRMLTVIAERADDPELVGIAGGKTGLITKQLKGIGKGSDFQVVESYEVDTALLREIRATQEQVAEELGERIKRHELTGKNGGPIRTQDAPLDLSCLTDDELEQLARLVAKSGNDSAGTT